MPGIFIELSVNAAVEKYLLMEMLWQSYSLFPVFPASACVVEYEDGHTCQQSLQRFLVCDTLIVVSFVFLGSRCSYNFKEFFP